MTPWIIYSDINTMCTFPPLALLFPFFSLSEAMTSTKGSGTTQAGLVGGELLHYEVWGLKKNPISVYVAAVKT